MAKAGDRVLIVTQKKKEEGVLMPSPDEKAVLIKLDSGYNLGFEKKEVKEIRQIGKKLIGKKKETKQSKGSKLAARKGLKTVSILHCGGTIASKIDYETGAVKAKFTPEELVGMFPEIGGLVNLRSRLVANMMSENMRFAHYNLIAREIEKEVKEGTDGVIITHGTDTLHYTAAALAFILEGLGTPVLLVGAQRSSDRGSSDAFLNLKGAVQFIINSSFAEVGVCMHASAEDEACVILPAAKSRKMHSSRRDAFKAVNSQPFALVNADGQIKWLRKDHQKKNKKEKLKLKLFDEKLKIGLVKAHPQMFAEELKVFEKSDGLVLEGTGLGHFPIEDYDQKTKEHGPIFKEIGELAKKMPVVMTSQTIFGGVNMNVYSPGRKLVEAGVLGNGLDITAECALIKLGWLLSNYSKAEVKERWGRNFRGEISGRRGYEKDFLNAGYSLRL